MPDTRQVELHFQDYFDGEQVEVEVGGRKVAGFTAKTRMQIGLAHIERLDLADGARVTIRVSGAGEKSATIVKGVTVLLVKLSDKTLSVEPARESPIYM